MQRRRIFATQGRMRTLVSDPQVIAPNFKQWLPHGIHPLIESGILLATIAAVALNAFFNGTGGNSVEDARRAASMADH